MDPWLKSTAASLCMLAALGAAADVARTKEQSYLVKYSDGTAERYLVKWTLDVTSSVREEGTAFVPYQGAVDNRRCTLSIASGVERTVALMTRLGQAVPLPGMNRGLAKDARNSACGDRREKALQDARDTALVRFEALTATDLESIRKETEASAGVVAFTVQ